MAKKPLILVTNDDSVHARGLQALIEVVKPLGEVVVVSTEMPMSGKSSSLTVGEPIRIRTVEQSDDCTIYVVKGTPADCVKLAYGNLLGRKPDILVSGINHGANSSVNVIYSGTMGAVFEGCMNDTPSIGFSLLDHSQNADFEPCKSFVEAIIKDALSNGLPQKVCLNVNIPAGAREQIKGIKVGRQAHSAWKDGFEKRIDPYGMPYWWLTGNFVSDDRSMDTDLGILDAGYISIVPTQLDMTHYSSINILEQRYADLEKK